LPDHLSDSLLWHPFQLWQIRSLSKLRNYYSIVHGIAEFAEPSDSPIEAIEHWSVAFAANPQQHTFLRVLALLLLSEPLIHLALDSRVITHKHLPETLSGYFSWRDAFQTRDVLSETGLDIDEAINWHKTIAVDAQQVDPLKEFRILLRYASKDKRDLLQGDPLCAYTLYDAAEIIRRMLEQRYQAELTSRAIILPEEHDVNASWGIDKILSHNERHYDSKRATGGDRKTLRRILREYDMDPQPRLTWIVEGDTEAAFFPEYARLQKIDLSRAGIELFNIRGTGGLRDLKTRDLLERFRREEIFADITIDRDGGGEHLRQLKIFRNDGLLNSGFKLWEPDFEEANFTFNELATVVSQMIADAGGTDTMTEAEIRRRMQAQNEAAGKAIEALFGIKKFPQGKGKMWGEALARWVLANPCPDDLVTREDGKRPAQARFEFNLRSQTSSYKWTEAKYTIDDAGNLIRRTSTEENGA